MRASQTISHPPDRIFAFLSDLHNHWRLGDAFVEVGDVREDGGGIVVRGPLGIARAARTVVVETAPDTLIRGRAEIGTSTVGYVAWVLEPDGAGTRVTLSASVERASVRDRLLLALGGRRWLRRRFVRVLEQLEHSLA